jgi:hypothetical protein
VTAIKTEETAAQAIEARLEDTERRSLSTFFN